MAHLEENPHLLQSEIQSDEVRLAKGEAEGASVVAAARVARVGGITPPSEGRKDAASSGETQSSSKAQISAPDSSLTVATTSPLVPSVPARPTLVQLGSSGFSTPATQQKKFSASNINKKFLEKASSASASAPSTLNSSIHKPIGTTTRPAATTAASHPRLVTTKLTAAPQSSSPGPGWSRPSSATPTIASSASPTLGSVPNGSALPSNSGSYTPGSGNPSQPTSITTSSSVPPTPAGKVIQPQPRSALLQTTGMSAKVNSKPVWGNAKAPASATKPISDPNVQADFPTAAEVAQGAPSSRKSKQPETKTADEAPMSSKQVRNEEADTFRGVHLDPNAHHWDEMEEDGDDFLNNVIEFNDGRQYKIESTTAGESPPRSPGSPIGANGTHHSRQPSTEASVPKEERFVDDFDRRWPRSKPSPGAQTHGLPSASGSHHTPSSASASPLTSHQHYSPTEGSRVLFNERSNRLEPYSGSGHFRSGHDSFSSNKRSDHSTSPSDFRRGRDLPPHHAPANFQLLQKQGNDFHPVPRPHNGGVGYGHRDSSRRDANPSAAAPLRSPRLSDSFGTLDLAGTARDRETPTDQQRGRRPHYNMGPPPVPPHARDSRRQVPPHLSQTSPSISNQRLPSRDGRYPVPPSSTNLPPPPSPALSHSAPATGTTPFPGLPAGLSGALLDDVSKDVMHDAATRAKQRRQAEEAEREKERERARQKAAQIEEKLKAAEAEKLQQQTQDKIRDTTQELDIVSVIEEAVEGVPPPNQPEQDGHSPPQTNRPLKRPPSLTGVARPGPDSSRPELARRNSHLPSSPTSSTPPAQADSWRSKANPASVSSPPAAVPSKVPSQSFTAVSVLNQIESSFTENTDQDLEVVDFSELGKFVGDAQPSEGSAPLKDLARTRRPRPVALDFFEDRPAAAAPASPPAPTGAGSWRRKATLPQPELADQEDLNDSPSAQCEIAPVTSPKYSAFDGSATSISDNHANGRHHGQVVASAPHGQPRTPRSQNFSKDMSAIDDAMLRIKGAIDGMHESQKELVTETTSDATTTKVVSSSLPKISIEVEPPFTRHEPPPSPRVAWSVCRVRIPKVSVKREPVSKLQLFQFQRGSRWVEVSTLPPRIGRPDFSVTEFLFGKPRGKYRVYVPRLANIRASVSTSKTNASGTFGKPSVADTSASWRKPASLAPSVPPTISEELETTSRSPPPDAAVPKELDAPKAELHAAPNADTLQRRGSQRKMPIGSAVAAYRDSRIDVLDIGADLTVNFTVGSELDDAAPTDSQKPQEVQSMILPTVVPENPQSQLEDARTVAVNGGRPDLSTVSPLTTSKLGSKASDSSSDQAPRTPSNHISGLWSSASISFPVKDSPVREGVDHPHIKELWTQISEKPSHPTINSLERIEDELPALPSTLQDVKSEGGETPPPSSASHPRMSQFDVTRGFQQVPTSTSGSASTSTSSGPPSHRPVLSSPATSAPVARPGTYSYPMATSPSPSWPMYNYPMVAHSPAPVMYGPAMTPSPVPARMTVNGQAAYAWIPAAPPTGQPAGMMGRMPPSPYPIQMTAYPSPGTPTLYGASPGMAMQSPQTQPASNVQNRGRNASLASPLVAPGNAHPYYANQAMVMQPSMSLPQNHAYNHDPGRGPIRHDNGHAPMQHPMTSHPNYGPAPPTTFSRPW